MEGFQPSFMEVDNMTWDQLGIQSLEDISELLSPPPEVPVNQSSISCNDQGGQNNVINDSIQQTTPFPTSFPETMMEGFQPSMDDLTEFDLESLFLLPADNQGSILCNDQGGQNNVINDSIQQTTQFPTSFPETMTGHRYMTPNATTSQHGEFNQSGPSSPALWDQPNPNLCDPQRANPLRDHQLTNYQLPMRNQVPAMLPGPQPPMNQRLQYSNTHQPRPGHGYMTPNATTSQHGGFNQPGPSFPAPRIQFPSNQGQVDQAAVIPDIDNMQQENFLLRNSGNSTRSQMDNVQVQELQNQTARSNASNPGLDTSLQSQIRGLNTQQVESNDRFWNYVEKRDEMVGSLIKKVLKCKFCPHTFAIKTAITRIKWHLSGERGHNVAICHGVTKEVQEAAFLALCGANKRQKITASAVNVNDCGISTCPQEQNNEIENLGGGIGRVQGEVQVVEPGVGEERISSQAIAGNDEVSMTGMRAQEDRVSEGALVSRLRTEPVDRSLEQSNAVLGNLAGGAGRIQVGVQGVLEQGAGEERINRVRVRTEPVEEDVENSRRSVQVGAGARSSESLKYNKTRGLLLPLSSTKPVGQAFEENTKVIWSLLMDGDVSTIGIYGMGGVGKSTILQHIHNELLQKPDICYHVWWVTVSQDFSINRLQNIIAKRLDLDLSSEDDDLLGAAKLSEELRKKQKWILILDDLWNNFKLHEVGIPEKLEGCKVILTTRSEMVCHGIACDHKIKVKPLSEGEAWTLFKENLGCGIALSSQVEGIAKDIARECAGLPLGIITVAGSLRGVNDLHEWRHTLKKLRESEFRDKEVFKLLRFSYDRLGDLALQQCLLYCALFPEDRVIEREELIGYLIDEGIIKVKRSRGDAFDEGHTMLNRLENVCLLEGDKFMYGGGRFVKMHDLIRDMAIHILLESPQYMVKAGAQLKELPDVEEWTENLTRVSLMQNKIKEIPSSYSPRCPYLSTLFLCDNDRLRFVADSFFKQLHGLKVLDLSCTVIENLPDSVSDLVSLTALLLNHCEKLRRVPSLEKLQALKRLSFSHTALEKIPQGMECLTNLRYLIMNGCGEKKFPSGILPKLSHLQVFVLEEFTTHDDAPITVKGKEVGSLRNLETLECHFEGFSDFVEYLRSRDGILSLSTYKILVGEVRRYLTQLMEHFPSKTVGLGNLSINRDFQVKFLNGIQGLICECIDARSLCDVLSLENATELERISIRRCHNMESLVSSSWFCSAPPRMPSCNGTFSGLKVFFCVNCKSMKKLFPLVLLPNLVNLERIEVSFCYKMEEIIGTTDEESSTSNSITEVILPKLITLELFELPELKSICSAKLICNSLKDIKVISCEQLKRMPICLPLLENGQPSPPPSLKNIYLSPKRWWESVVEWEQPNLKDVLRPFVK
ncbi:probable disease resistance protein At4g27220 isoform X1 [Populus alba]|uniref:probable disease resistance protein At4g27220 isoform X1 n=2 Tax=Populus alba TaxID=43335 RepID=UPI003CC727D6